MTNTQPVIDVNDSNFEEQVVARSHDVPIVVDFWAPWCGPCRALGPVLEKLAAEAGGAWVLAKINVDDNQQSARSFGVRGIPAVKAFKNGQVVDEFSGALPQRQVERWLEGILPTRADTEAAEAKKLERDGQLDQAASIYRSLLSADPDHPDALLGMARIAATSGEYAEAADFLDRIPEHSHDARFYRVWLDVKAAQSAPIDQLQARVAEDPGDLEALYQLGITLAADAQFDEALEHLLQVVIRDRGFRDDIGRETMVRMFEMMGPDTDHVRQWRKRLGRAMY